jgi:hypothetical protein
MNKQFLLLFAACLLCGLPGISQDQYAAGRVYLPGGDTLSGFISSQNTARFVRFKNASDQVTEFQPSQLAGFERDEVVYASQEVYTEPFGVKTIEPVFMQLLAGGKVNLYTFQEKNSDTFYYAEKEGIMIRLEGGKKLITVKNESYFTADKTYQVFLQQLFSDCSKPNLHLCEYTRKGLSDAVLAYNRCTDATTARESRKKGKIRLHSGIRAGVNAYSENGSAVRLSRSAGLFVNMPLGGANRILSGQVELNFNQYRGATEPYRLRYDFVDFTPLLKVTYPKGWVRPFLATGFSFGPGEMKQISARFGELDAFSVTQVKLLAETGLQVPLGRRFAYAAGHENSSIRMA